MTLDENDVNGFSQTAQGKRAAKKAAYLHSTSGAIAGSGGPKKHKEVVLFGDDVPYDPLRPCDYVSPGGLGTSFGISGARIIVFTPFFDGSVGVFGFQSVGLQGLCPGSTQAT